MLKKILITLTILILISLGVGGHFYNKYWHEMVRSQPQKYAYDVIRGNDTPVSVLIIEDIDLKEPYLNYYYKLESGVEPFLDDRIPLKGLPQYDPVYVINYTKDSLLAEVVSYYNRGAYLGGSYTQGWVYTKNLHEKPFEKK